MYIRTVKNSQGHAYYQVMESYWEDGRSKQRLIMSLGRVGEDGEKNLDSLVKSISKHRDILTVTQLAKEVSVDQTYILGPLLVLEKLFERFGIDEIANRLKTKHPQLELDVRKTLFTMVACRFVKPGSKLKIFEHWKNILYPELIDSELPLHHLYRVLDILSEHKEDIESSLYWKDRDLLSQPTDIVLYDLTTLRFESTKETEDLRRFGFSKEMRTDCTQVVLGLLLDTDGIPLGFEVYPGNTFEGKTLSGIVEKMRKKFQIRRFIFVADRGLFSKNNIDILKQDDGEFIVGCKLWSMTKGNQEEVKSLEKFTWVILEELAIFETKSPEGDRLIITWSKVRAERDAKARADILVKIEKKLLSKKKVTTKELVTNSNYKKYLKSLEGGTPEINMETIELEKSRDGFFGIITNAKDLKASQVVTNYKELWKIEDAFGELKGTLKTRPIFHWTDGRIVGHLVVCFLAYYCEAQITKMLRENGKVLTSPAITTGPIKQRALTVAEAMKELNEVRAVPVKIRGNTIWCRTDIAGNAAKIFQTLGLKIPSKVLKTESIPADMK